MKKKEDEEDEENQVSLGNVARGQRGVPNSSSVPFPEVPLLGQRPNLFFLFSTRNERSPQKKTNNHNITQQHQQPQLEKSNQIKIPRGRQSK